MKLHIAQVNHVLYDDEAEAVTVPSTDGEITVLSHHEPFITTLTEGTITVKPWKGDGKTFDIKQGVLEVSNNKTTVLL
ncbi:hypothetical protein GVX82_03300 [Patescibacteria group bacterium]|jgi:F-type H+-transporting ATPase subunit epsilon|nr:hypothetical protein [Patescibacteria group bacterium]